MSFTGFPPDLLTFLSDLAENNERAWFQENKPRYEASVVAPCLDFIAAMAERLPDFAPHFTAIPKKVGGSMFRIHRDVRFSKDKSPYKTQVGLNFRHAQAKDAHAPGFYLHLAPGEIFYGGGMWMPPSPALKAIRQRMIDRPGDWEKVTGDPGIKKTFGSLAEGDPLKTAPRGVDPDHPLIGDLRKRSFFVTRSGKANEITRPAFVDTVANSYKQATPLLRFLCAANNVPF